MAGILRQFLHVVPRVPSDDGDDSVEYSIAMEYHGPPLEYNIPQLAPINIEQIPTAAILASTTALLNKSLPVIHPIAKTDQSNKKLSYGIGHSGTLGMSDSCHNSAELSRNSSMSKVPDDHNEGIGFEKYTDPTNWESAESVLSSPTCSSGGFSCKGEDSNDEVPHHVKKPSIVTFRDPESTDFFDEESVHAETKTIRVKQKVEKNVKKGSCYRCLKGNRFTEKEVCIVCDAKYCCNCVLRAMGSMPEGRKCVDCIGYGIDETKRGTLGKCSRMLKRLLPKSEVKRVMSSEMFCEENMIPPELVIVNGKPLCEEELVLLLNCRNSPKKLKPGRYWYDKVSGFWGKEGQKPYQIISPHLDVGGHIRKDASNGNTCVIINNREITRAELWMLQLSGIQCEGKPHFWVSADGSYQEEGQKNVMGKIWGKTKTKLVCRVLSLPNPSDSVNPCKEEVNGANPIHHKFLLVGDNKSGTSTIFKQAKLLYDVPFSEDERRNISFVIQINLYGYLGILLEGRECFEEEILIERKRHLSYQLGSSGNMGEIDKKTIYSIGPRLKEFSDGFLKVMASGNLEAIFADAAREYAPFLEELWRDPAIQATYNRRNELQMLPRFATYFLERAVEISRPDYEPSDMDILYAEGMTSNGLACMEFLFPKTEREECLDPAYQHDPTVRYQLIRVHPKNLGENCKWLEMFEDVDVVLFCVSLSDYDEYCTNCNGVSTNKMLASKQLFESIVTHPTFGDKDFLLILNKFDLLEEKIEHVPLSRCDWFHDFSPLISHNPSGGTNNSTNPSLAHRAFHYISYKFKRFFNSLTDECKLYVSLVNGLEPDTVDEAFRFAREILKWNTEEPNFMEVYSSSIEASTS